MAQVSIRYIVLDVDAAIAFYRDQLGFTEDMHPAPTFAMLSRGDLRLLLNAPGAAVVADRRCPTARRPSRAAGTASSSRSPTSPPRSSVSRGAGVTLPQRDRPRDRRRPDPRGGPLGQPGRAVPVAALIDPQPTRAGASGVSPHEDYGSPHPRWGTCPLSSAAVRGQPSLMADQANPPLTSVSAWSLRELLAAERDPHRRQRELVRASLLRCPSRARPGQRSPQR